MSSTSASPGLRIEVTVRSGFITETRVASSRQPVAQRLLGGRNAEAAIALVPRVYSLCARSQAIAARLALAAAAGGGEDSTPAIALGQTVRAEIAHEILWRILLDWPEAVGQPAAIATLARARAALAADHADADGAVIHAAMHEALGEAWDALRDPSVEHEGIDAALDRAPQPAAKYLRGVRHRSHHIAATGGGASCGSGTPPAASPFGDVALLAAQRDASLPARLSGALDHDPGFESSPHLEGQPAETGALARRRDDPAVATLRAVEGRSPWVRQLARLRELAALCTSDGAAEAWCGGLPTRPGEGLGWVETARGLLIHRATVCDGQITSYRIVAPTEWNFHPRGVLPRALLGVPVDGVEAAHRLAADYVAALDPCVSFTVVVSPLD